MSELRQPASRVAGGLKFLAAPHWTILFFLLTAAAALAIGPGKMPATGLIAIPFGLLVVNLLAAIVSNARFRADLALLVFHLALLALVVLFAWARLSYLDATTTLTSGTEFEGRFDRADRGPFHPQARLSALRFANEGLSTRHSESGTYRGTYNRVSWLNADGKAQEAEIGDDRPLLLGGYRIYATFHRGLAPLFRWQATGQPPALGSVQMADHRERELPPTVNWSLPDGPEVWVQLEFASLPKPTGSIQRELGAGEIEHSLILRSGDDRHVMRVGDTVSFPQGNLTYMRLDSWMSYRIVYDPATPWIMATLLVGVGSLIWFYLRRMRALPSEPGS